MARTRQGELLTQLHRQQQMALRAAIVREVVRLYPMWQPSDPASFGAFQDVMVLLTQSGAQRSAALSAAYYRLFRAVEVPSDAVSAGRVITPAAPPPVEQVRKSVAVTSLGSVRRALGAGQSYEQAMRNGLIEVSGSVSRLSLNAGRDTIMQEVQRDPKAQGWARVTSGEPCAFCAMLASRGPVYKEESVDFQAHDHCVPAGVMVNGPSTELGFRRWHEGELVVIGTAEGDELAVTPNHPVLTASGWKPAGLIEEGEEVAQRLRTERDSLLVPDEQHVPSPIEDVWRALSVNGLVSVPVASEDFHGDGLLGKGEVDIVAADSLLTDEGDPDLRQSSGQPLGAATCTPTISAALAGLGDAALMDLGVRLTASGLMSGRCESASFAASERCPIEHGGLFHGTPLDVVLTEPASHDSARYTMLISKALLRNTRQVALNQSGRSGLQDAGGSVRPRPRFDPPANQSRSQTLRVHAQLGSDLLERLSGGVKLSRVSHLRRVEHSGHVYNLQTAEGWYEAGGIIVSNCSCEAEPVYEGSEWPPHSREFEHLWAQAGEPGQATTLNDFRRLLKERSAA